MKKNHSIERSTNRIKEFIESGKDNMQKNSMYGNDEKIQNLMSTLFINGHIKNSPLATERESNKIPNDTVRYSVQFMSIILLISILFAACYHENRDIVPTPVTLIPHDTMVKILTDMQIIEGLVSYERLNRVNNRNLKNNYYEKMLQHYRITAGQLRDNLNFYTSHYDKMATIYDKVIEILTLENTKIKAIQIQREQAEKEKEKKLNFPPSPTWISPLSDTLFNTDRKISDWLPKKNQGNLTL